MKRRIILITVIVVVLGIAGGGIWVYHDRNTGEKLLRRVKMAVRVEKYKKAVDLADDYIEQEPDDWQGHYYKGRAWTQLGRYEDARGPLAKAGQLAPQEADVAVAYSETYALPAKKLLGSGKYMDREELTQQAIKLIGTANAKALEFLPEADRDEGKIPKAVLGQIGLNHGFLEWVYSRWAAQLKERALIEEDAGNTETAAKLEALKVEKRDLATEQAKIAIAKLSKCLEEDPNREKDPNWKKDPNRPRAAMRLVELCTAPAYEDMDSLVKAGAPVTADTKTQIDWPPLARAKVILYAVMNRPEGWNWPPPDARAELDKLIGKHPDLTMLILWRAKLARADETLTRQGRLREALKFVNDALKTKAGSDVIARAKLTKGQLLLGLDRITEAEALLWRLRSESRRWADAHYWYAKAAERSKDPAKAQAVVDAMLEAVRCQPNHAGARSHLAGTRLKDGYFTRAFTHAQALFRARPEVPNALHLYVVSAALTNQPTLIPKAFEKFIEESLKKGRRPREIAGILRVIIRMDRTDLWAPLAKARKLRAEIRSKKDLDPEADVRRLEKDLRELDQELAAHKTSLKDGARTAWPKALAAAGKSSDRALAAAGKSSDRPTVLASVAEGYALIRDAKQARAWADKARKCEAKSVEDRFAISRALAILGRTSEAEAMLTQAVTDLPSDPRSRFELARLQAKTGRLFQALEQYRRAAELAPGNEVYKLVLAEALLKGGELDACEEVLDTVTSPMAKAKAREVRLRVRLAKGDSRGVDEVLREFPDTARSEFARAEIAIREGRPKKAVGICQAVLADEPDNIAFRDLLARTYLRQGQREQAIAEYKRILQSAPDSVNTYHRLVATLAVDRTAEKIEQEVLACKGARPEFLDVAMGSLHLGKRQYDQAMKVYERLVQRKDLDPALRARAKIRRAQGRALGGDFKAGLAELDELAKDPSVGTIAVKAKLDVLLQTRRTDQAAGALKELAGLATKDPNLLSLLWVARTFRRLGRPEDAIGVCRGAIGLFPRDPRPRIALAGVLARQGKLDEAVGPLGEAIKLQPDDLRVYALLAKVEESRNRHREALRATEALSGRGQTGEASALSLRAGIFLRWGLNPQAIEAMTKLRRLRKWENPSMLLELGKALAAVGEKEQARAALGSIPRYARQYTIARQRMAALAPDDGAALAILAAAENDKPGSMGVLLQQMHLLVKQDRPADAVKAFQAFRAAHIKDEDAPIPRQLAVGAFRAMLEARDRKAAIDLCLQMAKQDPLRAWRARAALLMMDESPSQAASQLPEVAKSNPYEAMVGLALASGIGDAKALAAWADHVEKIGQLSFRGAKPVRLTPSRAVLVRLVAGRAAEAGEALKDFIGPMAWMRPVAEELIAHTAARPRAAEPAALLKASLAGELGLIGVARTAAAAALDARATCQWAANLAFAVAVDPEARRDVARKLQPRDCLLAYRLQATVLTEQGHHAKAAEAWAKAIEKAPANIAFAFSRAAALEAAGQIDLALALYRTIWESTKDPAVANNAAYLTTRLHAKDAARLAEARGWMDEALKVQPGASALRDTRGWIALLQGDGKGALADLRQAVKGLPASIEVHCHLSLAEKAAGDPELARWHFEAAELLVKAKSEAGEIPKPEAEALAQARKAWAVRDGETP